MSKTKRVNMNERFDRGKWWFNCTESKVFIVRSNGAVKTHGKELKDVICINPSSSKHDQMKVSSKKNIS